eukprot:7380301-Prymnesium_polylepis.1
MIGSVRSTIRSGGGATVSLSAAVRIGLRWWPCATWKHVGAEPARAAGDQAAAASASEMMASALTSRSIFAIFSGPRQLTAVSRVLMSSCTYDFSFDGRWPMLSPEA